LFVPGVSYPKSIYIVGPGGTGKSHFIDTVCKMLGEDNISSVSMHDLEKDRFATSDLYCKLLNSFGDMEQSTLPNVNILKMLTSNKDVIRAQRKGERALILYRLRNKFLDLINCRGFAMILLGFIDV